MPKEGTAAVRTLYCRIVDLLVLRSVRQRLDKGVRIQLSSLLSYTYSPGVCYQNEKYFADNSMAVDIGLHNMHTLPSTLNHKDHYAYFECYRYHTDI